LFLSEKGLCHLK